MRLWGETFGTKKTSRRLLILALCRSALLGGFMAQDVSRQCHPLPVSKPSSTSRRAATISAIRIKVWRIRISQITNIDEPKSHGKMKGPSKGPSRQYLQKNKENNIHIMPSDCFSRSYLAIESIPNHWVDTLQFLVWLGRPKLSLASTWPSQSLIRFDESSFPSHTFSHSMKGSRDQKTHC